MRTAAALAALLGARLTIAALPFKYWRSGLGFSNGRTDKDEADLWASHVDWAARQSPGEVKCLPQAMALSWLLRRKRVRHALVFAVRPSDMRGDDALHSWVEVGGEKVIGDLPGPWIETLRLPAGRSTATR